MSTKVEEDPKFALRANLRLNCGVVRHKNTMELCHCPRDSEKLVVSDSEGHSGFVCGRCYGTWLPFGYIATVESKRQFTAELFIRQLRSATKNETDLPCPSRCGNLSLASGEGIELEWCPSCKGVWFDNGELKKLLAAYPRKLNDTGAYLAVEGIGQVFLWLALLAK